MSMKRSRAASPQTRALLEVMLSQRKTWMHGYELSEQTSLKSGTLYPILMRLSDKGMLESRWEASPHEGRPPRNLYRLTALGITAATQLASDKPVRGALTPVRA
jgi:PadR family transcriptional regulator, regulatory protein PadR